MILAQQVEGGVVEAHLFGRVIGKGRRGIVRRSLTDGKRLNVKVAPSDSRSSLLPLREKGLGKRETVMTGMIRGVSTCHDRREEDVRPAAAITVRPRAAATIVDISPRWHW
ncbi:MAG: hypothetical protein DVS81_19820 [Candidatus Accumulibacter meliphilus]|uniref:Uncharacterized protein n=1 Tax=Candidatus Accumulibacter meliphilus TaxID=2211374 RepID=A0A369XFJ9_9PROT|nr:MAG: hypothetical protein DVS81_19820 [Candidatus Accumulibacter meliphilus]